MSDVRRRSLSTWRCVGEYDNALILMYMYALVRFGTWALFLYSVIPGIAIADILITEIMYDAEGSDAKKEWIEIYNPGPDVFDLSRVTLRDTKNHVLNPPPKNGGVGSLVVPPESYAIIASDAATFIASYPNVGIVIDSVMSLNNTDGSVTIASSSARFAKTMGAHGDGQSLQLSNGVWIHAEPTPGTSNASVSTRVEKTQEAEVKKSKQKIDEKIPSVSPKQARVDPNTKKTAPVSSSTEQSSPESQLASAAATNQDHALLPWLLGAAALALGSASAVTAIARERKKEWEIIDESE
jgi:hypothetical protein